VAHLIILDQGAPAILTFLMSASQSSGSGIYSGVSFGPASADRTIIVCVDAADGPKNTAVTIGGVSASLVIKSGQTGSTTEDQMWIAAVPTGTSGTIALTGQSGGATAIGVYAVTGLRSLTPTSTNTDNDFNGSTFTGIVTTTVNTLAGGFAISSATMRNGTVTSATWTGGNQDFLRGAGSLGGLSGANAAPTGTQNVTFTTQFNGGSGIGLIGVSASFR